MSNYPFLWLIRIPPVFADFAPAVCGQLGEIVRPLDGGYSLLRVGEPVAMRALPAWKYIEWNLPVGHAWPCQPAKMEGFVEKAATALAARFAPCGPQGVFAGPLQNESGYFRQLASNLRGRLLQLMSGCVVRGPEQQDGAVESLFCLVGKEGLFAGMASPRACNGLHPGGTKFLATRGEEAISRAGAKVAGALHYLQLFDVELPAGGRWLELGASPGGMTAELLRRGFRVTAIDRAPLDARIAGHQQLEFRRAAVGEYVPDRRFAALLCDMNGPAADSLAQVLRLAPSLDPPALVVFTLKTTRAAGMAEIDALFRDTVATAAAGGLQLLSGTHLPYNRREFTLFFQRGRHSPA
jgi:23S rRNA (cytidine2498-2'-O)-methyltransferase